MLIPRAYAWVASESQIKKKGGGGSTFRIAVSCHDHHDSIKVSIALRRVHSYFGFKFCDSITESQLPAIKRHVLSLT